MMILLDTPMKPISEMKVGEKFLWNNEVVYRITPHGRLKKRLSKDLEESILVVTSSSRVFEIAPTNVARAMTPNKAIRFAELETGDVFVLDRLHFNTIAQPYMIKINKINDVNAIRLLTGCHVVVNPLDVVYKLLTSDVQCKR